MATLVLLRHGESEWNEKNLFTGWVDVDLTATGEEQARAGGRQLRDAGLLPTVLHTSLLTRAIRTADLALDACGRSWLPVTRHWRLNERHYGDLQGKDKTQVREQYGAEQFQLWRRSYDTPPPPIEPGSDWDVAGDPRYARLTGDLVPRTECLKDVVHRLLPYWYDPIVPDLRAGETVLVAAHGNSLRALVEHLDGLGRRGGRRAQHPDRPAAALRPRRRPAAAAAPGGQYLDPEAAAAAAAAVAANRGTERARPLGEGGRSARDSALAGDQVDDPAGDRDGVVGEALVVAADERHVDRRLDAAVPRVVEDHREQLAVQLVHDVVVALELRGERRRRDRR